MRSTRSRRPTLGAASGFLSSPEAARAPRKLAAAGTGSARSEAFGPDPGGLVAGLHQQTGGGLDEPVRAADVSAAVWPGERGDELGGDAPGRSRPPFGRPVGCRSASSPRRALSGRRHRRASAPSTASRTGTCGNARRRWRSMHISGTTPEPPPISSSGELPCQVKYSVSGPRTSSSSPTSTTSWMNGETSPSIRQSTVSSISPSSKGLDAIE